MRGGCGIMICESVYSYCKDNISDIENFIYAINDRTQIWDCHHRLETDQNITKEELLNTNKYFNRPSSELIFLTKSDHCKLHHRSDRFITDGTFTKKISCSDAIPEGWYLGNSYTYNQNNELISKLYNLQKQGNKEIDFETLLKLANQTDRSNLVRSIKRLTKKDSLKDLLDFDYINNEFGKGKVLRLK